MSAVYLDIMKDRLYCSAPSEPLRKTAQTTIYLILHSLTRLLAPLLTFTSDEVWQYIPGEKEESVHLAKFPSFNEEFNNTQLAEKWDILLKTRDRILKYLEESRAKKEIGNSLEASINLVVPRKLNDLFQAYRDQLADLYIVSSINIESKEKSGDFSLENLVEDIEVTISRVEGKKCERCWKYFSEESDSRHPGICNRCLNAIKLMAS
jgi:isoleucyl-tRNA synthetase